MSEPTVLYEASDAIATITLNRPDRLNALTKQVEDELFAAMRKAEQADDVRVIILTGAGRGFCAGADLEALSWIAGIDWQAADKDEIREKLVAPRPRAGVAEGFQKTYSYFPAIDKPIIAAVNGPAVGLGFILALYCDIRVASETARFGTAFAQRGLIAEHGLSWMLPRLVGLGNAFDLLYSARIVDAAEALQMGLVNHVEPPKKLMSQVRAYATQLATTVSPRSLRVIKRQVYAALFQDLGAAIETGNQEMLSSFLSEDFAEGIGHFLEKRPPRFTGK